MMFLMAVLGNTTYAIGIFLQTSNTNDLLNYAPWLVGSLGTVCFDFTVRACLCVCVMRSLLTSWDTDFHPVPSVPEEHGQGRGAARAPPRRETWTAHVSAEHIQQQESPKR
jgi:hypothetical protein